jgi:nicotinamidase-related amidase
MLRIQNAILLVVDVQERLVTVMENKIDFLRNLTHVIKGAQILGLPILWSEQAPEKIGKTLPEIADLLKNQTPIKKTTFSCLANDEFLKAFKKHKRKQVLIAGIEAHVCVYQTAQDLVTAGYEVQVIADAVSSRKIRNRDLGFDRIKTIGGSLTSVEMALCELLGEAKGEKFKQVLDLIK